MRPEPGPPFPQVPFQNITLPSRLYFSMSNGEECPGLSATPECTEASSNISEVTQSSPAPVPEALDAQNSGMEGHVGHCRGALALCQAQSLRPHTPWNPHSSSRESPLSLPLFCRQGKAKAQRGYVTFPVSHSQSSQSWYLGRGLLETKDLTPCYPGEPRSEGRASPSSHRGCFWLQHLPPQ